MGYGGKWGGTRSGVRGTLLASAASGWSGGLGSDGVGVMEERGLRPMIHEPLAPLGSRSMHQPRFRLG